ncbi:beta-ketoacyl synthase N-terminal-like domain-containing protein [Virgibacillus halodenitrificans]|uniref:beta-ketoacyl synthase N-terminal-like domain-containing protein n=1 Tax=Virgibacillus halodenitrificans TaxID=1482 RepID=UPI001F096D95|nr:beta-ketoacyl synthase N-terminal-like domain-containing protein [Virgibacillus halodenitrificans]
MTKIVATGMGAIAPNINNIDRFLEVLQNGENVLEKTGQVMPKDKTTIVGKVTEGLEEYLSNKEYRKYSRAMLMGMKAATEAVRSASIDLSQYKTGLFVGTTIGSISESDFLNSIIGAEEDHRKIVNHFSNLTNHHSIATVIGKELEVNGVFKTISTGCTSSLEAIEVAMAYLQTGKIDIAVVGGVDSAINLVTSVAFMKNRSLPINQDVNTGAVPFDERSKGFAISEAAGFLVLEREEIAKKRNAKVLGEVEQVLSNNDGIGIYQTDFQGEQLIKIVKEIVRERLPDYVNSQALGLSINDKIEKRESQTVFQHLIPYTSIKGMIGNPFGSVGVLQVISGLLSIQHGFIPPTIKTTKQGYEEMNINTSATYQEINEVLVTNHGHGGNNAVAYLKKHSNLKFG